MINWGIIGAGNIAHRFTKSLQHDSDCRLTAVSCRTKEKAQIFANEYNVPHAYGGFEHIIEDPEVDAVYIALPHKYHKEWALKCMQAGKPVLCEKPAVIHAEEMREIMDCHSKTDILFMEAMKTRFTPVYQDIHALMDQNVLGDIVSMHFSFCNLVDENKPGSHYYMDPAGGGALYDTGIYCIGWLDDYLKESVIVDHVDTVYKEGVDVYDHAFMHAGNIQLDIECAMDREKPRDGIIEGTKGKLIIHNMHRPEEADLIAPDREGTYYKPYKVDDFYGEIEHFNDLLTHHQSESDIMPLKASLHCAEIIDSIHDKMKEETC